MNTRRTFLTQSIAAVTLLGSVRSYGEEAKTVSAPASAAAPKDRVRPTQDLKVVAEFVAVSHRDLRQVESMVLQEPKLVLAAVDTGNAGIGDWETGLGAAAHMGRRDIAEFLLSKGARIDLFCAAALGYRDAVLGILKVEPGAANVKGPHGLTLLYHAAIGGDVSIAEGIKPLLAVEAPDFDQALTAAARDGRLAMTEWLLANGVSNVNATDAFGNTPLKIALNKGHNDVVALLRRHGGNETL